MCLAGPDPLNKTRKLSTNEIEVITEFSVSRHAYVSILGCKKAMSVEDRGRRYHPRMAFLEIEDVPYGS